MVHTTTDIPARTSVKHSCGGEGREGSEGKGRRENGGRGGEEDMQEKVQSLGPFTGIGRELYAKVDAYRFA